MGKILVVGSVHIDILADIDSLTKDNLDKIGRLHYGVGGTAFNVAANLVFHDQNCILFSVLKEESFSAAVIKSEFGRRGMSERFLFEKPTVSESGFVAHIQDGLVTSAVSCIAIQDISLNEKHLRRAIEAAELVAIDCNLATDQIQSIASIASSAGKPLAVCAVSESKVSRIHKVFSKKGPPKFKFTILNSLEFRKTSNLELNQAHAPAIYTTVCSEFSTEYLVVTDGPRGFWVIDKSGIQHFEASIANVVSTLGAGDAIYAAFCDHFLKNGKFLPDVIVGDAKKYLAPVLGSRGPVPDVKKRRRVVFSVAEKESIVALFAILGASAATVVGFFGPAPTRLWFGILLFASSMLAGIAGSILDSLLTYRSSDISLPRSRGDLLVRSILGIAAGLASGLLFYLPQLMSEQPVQNSICAPADLVPVKKVILIPFGVLIGMIAGLTAENLLHRLKSMEAVKPKLPNLKSDG